MDIVEEELAVSKPTPRRTLQPLAVPSCTPSIIRSFLSAIEEVPEGAETPWARKADANAEQLMEAFESAASLPFAKSPRVTRRSSAGSARLMSGSKSSAKKSVLPQRGGGLRDLLKPTRREFPIAGPTPALDNNAEEGPTKSVPETTDLEAVGEGSPRQTAPPSSPNAETLGAPDAPGTESSAGSFANASRVGMPEEPIAEGTPPAILGAGAESVKVAMQTTPEGPVIPPVGQDQLNANNPLELPQSALSATDGAQGVPDEAVQKDKIDIELPMQLAEEEEGRTGEAASCEKAEGPADGLAAAGAVDSAVPAKLIADQVLQRSSDRQELACEDALSAEKGGPRVQEPEVHVEQRKRAAIVLDSDFAMLKQEVHDLSVKLRDTQESLAVTSSALEQSRGANSRLSENLVKRNSRITSLQQRLELAEQVEALSSFDRSVLDQKRREHRKGLCVSLLRHAQAACERKAEELEALNSERRLRVEVLKREGALKQLQEGTVRVAAGVLCTLQRRQEDLLKLERSICTMKTASTERDAALKLAKEDLEGALARKRQLEAEVQSFKEKLLGTWEALQGSSLKIEKEIAEATSKYQIAEAEMSACFGADDTEGPQPNDEDGRAGESSEFLEDTQELAPVVEIEDEPLSPSQALPTGDGGNPTPEPRGEDHAASTAKPQRKKLRSPGSDHTGRRVAHDAPVDHAQAPDADSTHAGQSADERSNEVDTAERSAKPRRKRNLKNANLSENALTRTGQEGGDSPGPKRKKSRRAKKSAKEVGSVEEAPTDKMTDPENERTGNLPEAEVEAEDTLQGTAGDDDDAQEPMDATEEATSAAGKPKSALEKARERRTRSRRALANIDNAVQRAEAKKKKKTKGHTLVTKKQRKTASTQSLFAAFSDGKGGFMAPKIKK
eukprot:scaffold2393_cov267-Pinguiococcus_pyrenoidosus.AAC.24